MAALNVFLGGAESKWRDTSKGSTHLFAGANPTPSESGGLDSKIVSFFSLVCYCQGWRKSSCSIHASPFNIIVNQ